MRQNKRSAGATRAGQNIASISGCSRNADCLCSEATRAGTSVCCVSFYPKTKPAIAGGVASAVTLSLTLPESQGNAVQKAAEQHPEGVWSHSESLPPPKFKIAKVVNLLTIKPF